MKKAAIIGLGAIAPMHVKSLQAIDVTLAAVCDTVKSPEKMNIAPCCDFFSDFNELLLSGGFDVLHICLPHYLHAAVAISALERGVHVLCEKPMATTVADAEKMIAAAEKSGARLGVVFQNRFSPGALLIKNAIASGELGSPLGGWLRVTWFRDDLYYSESNWRGKKATEGGGVVINQSIHTFDLANFFLGEPASVSASVANRAHPSIEVEDVAEGVITYGNTNISFFVNTYHPYDAPASIELVCENGRAELIGDNATVFFNNGETRTACPDVAKEFGMKPYWGVSHVKQIRAFYDALAEGKSPAPSGEDALVTQRLVNGIYESARTRACYSLKYDTNC